jgi:DNA-binding MarR family transcriptional regulator
METNGKPSSTATLLPAADLEKHLGYWLRRVSNRVSGAFARALKEQHTSTAEWVVLRYLLQAKETTPGELAALLGMTRGAITKVLDKLEAKHWVTRTAKAEDQRVQLLALTRASRRILPRLGDIADSNDAHFFECLTAAEQDTLRRLLRKLVEFHGIQDVPTE